MKLKRFMKFRILLLVFFLILSLLIIKPNFNATGVAIKSIEANSSAEFAGMSFIPGLMLTDREIITSVNGVMINNLEDYSNVLDSLDYEDSLTVLTDKGQYVMLKDNDPGIIVDDVATSNLVKGLELQGGTRVLLEPEGEVTANDIKDIIDTMENRLNVYGLTDLTIKEADDLLGNNYIIIEIAGASKEEVEELVTKQGKFEAKIGDEVVFYGGKKDIKFVCRGDGTCSGIRSCDPTENGYQCRFEFSIKLSEDSSNRQASVTSELDINISEFGYEYLSAPLDLYLDDKLVDSLNIAADLKGKAARDILISGSGVGSDEQEAFLDATQSMNKLQTVLITGSLPTKLNVVKFDSISPSLGEEFVRNAFLVGILAIISVSLVVFIRYRKLNIALPMMLTCASEVLIILGIAALIKYNLDLAAIAGIIAAVGTGIDDQIIITDEVVGGVTSGYNWKSKLKKAFFIIMVAYATTVAAMLPLLKAGAGLLTGFAFATIVGVSVGVFITRPAFASIIEILLNKE